MGELKDRALPPCTHRPTCPGCPRYGERGISDEAWTRLSALAGELSAPTPRVISGNALGYRHRARLMVRGRARSPKIGLFQEGSHRIADTPRCPIHHPLINRVAASVREGMRRRGIEPYADAPHRGSLRAIQVVVERVSQSAQVVLVENASTPGDVALLEEDLADALGEALHSVFWNGNPERHNAVLGPHWSHRQGPESVVEMLGGARVHFPPDAFGQSHLSLFDLLLEQIAAWVPADSRITELYAGSGAIGLGLLARGGQVVFNERGEGSLGGLARGIAELAADARARARVVPGDAGDAKSEIRGADVVIVDPPRRGLDAGLLATLGESPPGLLIAVSCGLDAFEREARSLVASGRLMLRELQAYDLFPHTAHVETLARFERVD